MWVDRKVTRVNYSDMSDSLLVNNIISLARMFLLHMYHRDTLEKNIFNHYDCSLDTYCSSFSTILQKFKATLLRS